MLCRLCSALFILLLSAAPALAGPPPDPFTLYGPDMSFTVWRKGDQIGEHRVSFTRDNGALTVRSVLDLAVKFLGITVFRYHYDETELWRDGRVESLTSTVNDDGKVHGVTARLENGKLAVTGPDTHALVDGPILPSSHWDAQVITATRLLNTLNGKIDDIKLVPVGKETVPVGPTTREATHYRYEGPFQAESWYDAQGHWLKLRFPGTDGSIIDYVCVKCMATP